MKTNGVHLAPGNKQVAEWVGRGRTAAGAPVAVGTTDTDDALAEIHAGRPVQIIFPDGDGKSAGRMGTLFIPNTVCIIKGSPNPQGARRLVDFLLAPTTESALAVGDSHQIPLNPNVAATLPPEVKRPGEVSTMQVDFVRAADLWEDVQTFLRDEFARSR
jgi:iron(III) transport system substrate-binding protein